MKRVRDVKTVFVNVLQINDQRNENQFVSNGLANELLSRLFVAIEQKLNL